MDYTGFVVVIIKSLVLQVANATVCGGAFAFLPACKISDEEFANAHEQRACDDFSIL
jgi:hypothetical protein